MGPVTSTLSRGGRAEPRSRSALFLPGPLLGFRSFTTGIAALSPDWAPGTLVIMTNGWSDF